MTREVVLLLFFHCLLSVLKKNVWCAAFQGHRLYYHRVVVEFENNSKEAMLVKCAMMPHHHALPANGTKRAKRQDLAPDFVEEE